MQVIRRAGMVAGLWLAAMPALAAGLTPPPGGSPFAGVPEWLRPLAGWAFGLQRQLTGEMREHLAAIKDGGSTEAMAALVLAAFLYGVFHAIGPGHGKVVIGGLIATRRARIAHGIAASFVAAMVQAAVAVAAIAILAGALALAPAAVMDKAAWLEVGSFAMIAAVGMVMTWRSLTGRSGCGHAHHHPGAACCADHHHHHDDSRGLMAAAAAVGFRPCSGALLVLLFTWANGIAWVGVAATFAMGIGVGLTVSGIGLGALGLNRAVERLTGGSRWAGRLSSALALAGALAVTVLGLAMLAGSLIDGPALTG